jgi:hypothetical protein
MLSMRRCHCRLSPRMLLMLDTNEARRHAPDERHVADINNIL